MPYKSLFTASTSYTGLDLANTEHGLSQPDVVFDGGAIPFESGHFDSVVSFEVLDDLPDPMVQLKELQRVLKPGGQLLLTTSFVWEVHEEPHDIARYTEHGLRHLIESTGFEVKEIKKTRALHPHRWSDDSHVLVPDVRENSSRRSRGGYGCSNRAIGNSRCRTSSSQTKVALPFQRRNCCQEIIPGAGPSGPV